MGAVLSTFCPFRARNKRVAQVDGGKATPTTRRKRVEPTATPPNTLKGKHIGGKAVDIDLTFVQQIGALLLAEDGANSQKMLDDDLEADLAHLSELKKRGKGLKTELLETMEASRRASRALSEVSTPLNKTHNNSCTTSSSSWAASQRFDSMPLPVLEVGFLNTEGLIEESPLKVSEDMKATLCELKNESPKSLASHVSLPEDTELFRILQQQLEDEKHAAKHAAVVMIPKALSPVDEADTAENSWAEEHSSTQEANSSSALDSHSAEPEVDEPEVSNSKGAIAHDDSTEEIPRKKSNPVQLTDLSFDASDDDEEDVKAAGNTYLEEDDDEPIFKGISDPSMLPPSAFGIWFKDVVKQRYKDKLAIYNGGAPALPFASDTNLLSGQKRRNSMQEVVQSLAKMPQKGESDFQFNGTSYMSRRSLDRRRLTFGGVGSAGFLSKYQN